MVLLQGQELLVYKQHFSAMGVVTWVGAGVAGLIAAVLAASSTMIDFIDYAGGSEGVSVKDPWGKVPPFLIAN